jgi:hypothetical protein
VLTEHQRHGVGLNKIPYTGTWRQAPPGNRLPVFPLSVVLPDFICARPDRSALKKSVRRNKLKPDMGVNAGYKDSVFSLLFSDPDTLRELYSALEGVPLDKEIPVTITTLSDVLYMERYNDISFTIGNKLVVLIEHQSTINANMPLRILLYIARVYEKIIERKNLYRESLLKIPRPEFFVLYNGLKPYPGQSTLKLSDAFEGTEDIKAAGLPPELELVVKVYNINKGYNEDIARKCAALGGYSVFIDKIRENRATMPLEAAIEYCIEHKGTSENFSFQRFSYPLEKIALA